MYQPAQDADFHLPSPHLLTSAFRFEFLRRKANDVREFISNDFEVWTQVLTESVEDRGFLTARADCPRYPVRPTLLHGKTGL